MLFCAKLSLTKRLSYRLFGVEMIRHLCANFCRICLCLAFAMLVTSCGLPRSGPTESEIRASSIEEGGDTHIIDVTDAVVQATARSQRLGFSRSFLSAGLTSIDRIHPGDLLSITIWENVINGVFATQGQKVTQLGAVRVDQLGNIFVPYAGTVRASGRTPDDLRQKITELLAPQTPDPQIEVRREAGDGATVSILGGVSAQGVFPIEASTRRLTGMLATAGGVSVDPGIVKITVRRGREIGQIWMQDLFDNPANDIPLKAGDQITLEKDERYFVSMGTTGQRRVRFETHNPSIIEALAHIGGLRGGASNPKGIFIFRVEPATIVNKVLDRTDITTPQRVIYVVDLTKEDGMFTAHNFQVHNEDIIYVTEAPYVAWNKLLRTLMGTLNSLTALDSAFTRAAGVFDE